MIITVKLYGTLRRLSDRDTPGLWTGKIDEGATLLDLIDLLGTTTKEVARGAIDNIVVPLDTPIPHNGEVLLVTNMGGG